MSVVDHNVEAQFPHLCSLDVAAEPTRPLDRNSRLLRRQRVDDLHPRLLLEPRVHQSTAYPSPSPARLRPPVPHHRDHLLTEPQQRATHRAMTVVETHVRWLDEPPQHLHLLRQIRVVEENPVDRVLLEQHRVVPQPLQRPGNVLRAAHVPVLTDETQVPVEIRVVAETRFRTVLVRLVDYEN